MDLQTKRKPDARALVIFAKLEFVMRFIKYLILLFVIVLLVMGGVGYWFYRDLTTAKTHDKASQYINIPRGASPSDIIAKLNEEGVLSSSLPVAVYLRLMGKGSGLKSGEYRFPSPITPLDVIKKLEEGEERSTKLTIIEGWTRWEISKEIAEKFPPANTENQTQDPKAIFDLMNDASLISDIDPTAKNLEGYLYPDTYQFPRDFTPKQVVKALVDRFKKEWKPEYAARSKELNQSPHNIVTMASMIETESKLADERPVVASVIYNRLNKGIPLGLDVTNIYAAKLAGVWEGTFNKSDAERESPYNSRKYAGLPPTPVASPSIVSIKAALYPAQSDYIYYVRNVQKTDGSHNFYSNAADFERGKAAYQVWLEDQRRQKRENTEANTQ